MEDHNNIEVILVSKYTLTDSRQKEIRNWLKTILQPAIRIQHEKVEKMFLSLLKNTPAIYLS
jgi:hypothetical protein